MGITAILALLALLGLVVVFGVTKRIKGLKAAFITTGVAFLVFSILLVLSIYVIVESMS
jgi:hypothetical protein